MGHDSQELTALVQGILRVAYDLKEATASPYSPGHSFFRTGDSLGVIDCINLPSASPLLPSLLKAGASSEVASALGQIYQRRAEELRQRIQKSITTACRRAAELPAYTSLLPPDLLMKKAVSVFTEGYIQRLEEWKEETIRRNKQAPTTPAKAASMNPCTFNHEYVPLLEHFFEENPFPTHADKMFLAKKSNMQYRQIHVWFQNRRNRTKKEGKMLRKRPVYKGVMRPLDKLYERMEGHIVDSGFQAPKLSEAGSSKEIGENMPREAFASSSPPHAFPSSYPPTCHYDPFPCKSGLGCFPKPEWRRVSDCKHPPSLSTSIDDLVEMFSRLHVRDRKRSKGSPRLQSHAATVAITVIPSTAPHPSMIVRQYSQPLNIVQLRSSISAPVPCPRAFRSPSPTSKPITLVPPLLVPSKRSEPNGKRKTAPLPRRYLGQVQTAGQNTPPPESSTISSSSPRLFSVDSDGSGCSFSNISSVSTPSDTANIPELIHLSASPCRSPSDNLIYLRSLRDMVAVSP